MSARRGSKRRGRGWLVVGLVLVTFLGVASTVVWRRSRGIAGARELRGLMEKRAQLVAELAALQGQVRSAASRSRIEPIAIQRLGMHVPSDTAIVLVERRAASPRPATP